MFLLLFFQIWVWGVETRLRFLGEGSGGVSG